MKSMRSAVASAEVAGERSACRVESAASIGNPANPCPAACGEDDSSAFPLLSVFVGCSWRRVAGSSIVTGSGSRLAACSWSTLKLRPNHSSIFAVSAPSTPSRFQRRYRLRLEVNRTQSIGVGVRHMKLAIGVADAARLAERRFYQPSFSPPTNVVLVQLYRVDHLDFYIRHVSHGGHGCLHGRRGRRRVAKPAPFALAVQAARNRTRSY